MAGKKQAAQYFRDGKNLMKTWILPTLIGLLSIFGLVAGLLADGLADILTWLTLAIACSLCIVVTFRAMTDPT